MDDVMCTSIPKVVVHDGRILEKPTSADEARRFIAGYRTSPAQTVGGITVSQPSTGRSATGVDTATIHFGAIPDDIIDALIERVRVIVFAGGIARPARTTRQSKKMTGKIGDMVILLSSTITCFKVIY